MPNDESTEGYSLVSPKAVNLRDYPALPVQSTSLITTFGGASKKCPYSRSVVISEVSLCITVGRDLASSEHGNSVVIRELSLYPQSLLAKLTVLLILVRT